MHNVRSARALALLSTGSNSAARMAMMAMTTSSSIKVNARPPRKAPARQARPARVCAAVALIEKIARLRLNRNPVFD
jgi:hypothetical protein